MTTRNHLVTLVNKANIRKNVIYNGRPHTVVTSKTLPFDVVMNDILYPKDQIVANYQKLEGTPAPIGHPKDSSGKFISAKQPEGLNLSYIGAWNRSPKIVGNRVELETWIDNDVAQRTAEGRELLDRIDKGDPISTSVAVLANRIERKGKNYSGVAEIIDMDHNAILLNEPPAATIDQGVGLMVNTSTAIESEEINSIGGDYDVIKLLKKALFFNGKEEGKTMEKDNELHLKVDKLADSVGVLVNLMKDNEEKKKEDEEEKKKKDEVVANCLKNLESILLANVNKELEGKRAKVSELLGNAEAPKAMDEASLDAVIAKLGGGTANILGNHQSKEDGKNGSIPKLGGK